MTRKNWLIHILTSALSLLGAGVLLADNNPPQVPPPTALDDLEKRQNQIQADLTTEQKARIAETAGLQKQVDELSKMVPQVGSILSYTGDLNALSDKWKLCNGTVINDPDSPLNGKTLPKLDDLRLLVGTGDVSLIGINQGTNQWDNDGSHGHSGTATAAITKSGWSGGAQFESEGDHTADHSHPFTISSSGGHNHGEKMPQHMGTYFVFRIK